MPPIILRIILIVFGILLFVCAMLSYAGKKLKKAFYWGGVCLHCFLSLQALFRHSASVPGLSLFFPVLHR